MKPLGLGCMRLPMVDNKVDITHFSRMVDSFLEAGFTYFDTAHGYINGTSETVVRAGVTSRYPREAYLLADKLSPWDFSTEEEIVPLFYRQLEACGVEYFDYYLMHGLHRERYYSYKGFHAFEIVQKLRDEGRVRHIGISFHGSAEELDEILSSEPCIEVVQIQFNYVDYLDKKIDSKGCYEVCRKHNKPVIIMEPVKGGLLADLPDEAAALVAAQGETPASLALRYAASFPGVVMVLSGMGSSEQMEQNIALMNDFQPLDASGFALAERVRTILDAQDRIPCTGCAYCVKGCPKNIPIPELFDCVNTARRHQNWDAVGAYRRRTKDKGKASDCIACGACEKVCPQQLPIRTLLQTVTAGLER